MPSLQRGNLICVWMTGFDMVILLSCLHSGGVTFQSSALPTNIWYVDYFKHSCQSLDSHWQKVHVNRAPWVWQLKQVFVKLFLVAAPSHLTLHYSSVSRGTLKYFLVLHGTQLLSSICGTLNYCPLSHGTQLLSSIYGTLNYYPLSHGTQLLSSIYGTLNYCPLSHGTQLLSSICGTLNYCPLSHGTNYCPVSAAH